MPAIRNEFSWTESILKRKMPDTGLMNHSVFLGSSMAGKSFLMSWLIEYAVAKGFGKAILMNCSNENLLEEALMFLFPNLDKEDARKMLKYGKQPRNFKVKVYVPVSNTCPDTLPEIFQPFTIPVNDLTEEAIQILYGDRDITRIKSIYATQIQNKKNVSYSDLKNILRKWKNKNISEEKGFMGLNTMYFSPKAQKKTIEGFFARMQLFNQYGILSSARNKYNLRNFLQKELEDQQTIVVLYTGFLKDDLLKHFVVAYFAKTIEDEMKKIKSSFAHKIIEVWEEIRFIFPSQSEQRKKYHYGMSDLGARLLTEGRHSNIELWLAAQSPDFISGSMMKNIQTKFVTHFKEKDDIEWVADYYKEWDRQLVRDLFKAFERQREKKDYRFLVLEEAIDKISFQANLRKGWGSKLPYPRLSFYRFSVTQAQLTKTINKVPIEDWRILRKDPNTGINLGIELSDEIKKAKRNLFLEFKKGETQLKTQIETEKAKRRQDKEIERRKLLEQDNKDTEKVAIAYLEGKSLIKISTETGLTEWIVRRKIEEAKKIGLIPEQKPEKEPNGTTQNQKSADSITNQAQKQEIEPKNTVPIQEKP